MRLRDCLIKRGGGQWWLHHSASSYKVRINEDTLERLSSMLAKGDPARMDAEEKFLYDKLSERSMLSRSPATSAELPVLDKSLLDLVDVEFSGVCNLRCRHCYARMSQRLMDRDTLDAVVQGVRELEPVTVSLGGGEPLLNPLFKDAVRAFRGEGARVCVMTNASAVDRDMADFFAEARVAKATVSLDGFKDHHDRLRGPGSFEAATAGIRRLAAAGVCVSVTSMVSDANYSELDAFRSYCRDELGVGQVRLAQVVSIGRAANEAEDFMLSDENLRALQDDVGFHEVRKFSSCLPPAGSTFPCGAGVSQCFIAADGGVYACHYFQNIGETMGRLGPASLKDLYLEYLKTGITNNFDPNSLEACAGCAHLARCRGGCRARAKILKGRWTAPDPNLCQLYLADAASAA